MRPTDLSSLHARLHQEEESLLAFAAAARLPSGGFGWLDGAGRPDPHQPVHTWVTARMTYVFALAALRGGSQVDAEGLADHGIRALDGLLRDREHGGWYPTDPRPGAPDDKKAYDHAFVVLASAAATAAQRPGARQLLDEALQVVDAHFWSAEDGLAMDVWDRAWVVPEAYRGANANMHMVEAFLAASDVTGDRSWRDRALGIAERLVHGHARAASWRLPEHFDTSWHVLPDYNREAPADPFRPYGATVGHWLEWARLLVHLRQGADQQADRGAAAPAPQWLLDDAAALFEAAVREGWAVDGDDGFVYTVDADGQPVVHARMHWVVTEALGAAAVLHEVTGEADYARWLQTWWDYAERHLVDAGGGSWHHELDRANRVASGTWSGKPDVYHAYQAALLTQLPVSTSLVAALGGGGTGGRPT